MIKKNIVSFIIGIIFVISGCGDNEIQIEKQSNNVLQTSQYTIEMATIKENIPLSSENSTDIIYNISYTYPVITSQKKDNITKVLNDNLKKEAEEFIKKTKESNQINKAREIASAAKKANKEFYPHSTNVNYILEYNKNNIISFLKAKEEYTGEISHIYNSEGVSYNLETGKKLELDDIFEAANLGLIKILSDGLKNQADIKEDNIKNNINSLNWYLTNEGIVFFFNPNTIVKNKNDILKFTYTYEGNKTMFKGIINELQKETLN